MPEDQTDQDKFDAILKRLINSPPLTMKEAVAKPKIKKNGEPRMGRASKPKDSE